MGKDDIVDTVGEQTAEIVVPKRETLAQREGRFVSEQQEVVYLESIDMVAGTLRFADIEVQRDPDSGMAMATNPNPPDAWVKELGMERAKRYYRLAVAGWDSKSAAPHALDVAVKIATTVMKVEAVKAQSSRVMNILVQPVEMPSPHELYPEVVIDDED